MHVRSPSARSASLSKIRVRNLRTGQVLDKDLPAAATGSRAEPGAPRRAVPLSDGDGFHFMDTQSYDQFALSAEDIGDAPAT